MSRESPEIGKVRKYLMNRHSRAATAAIALALALFTVVAYLPVRRNGFILFDDPGYITNNAHVSAGLTRAGLAWALTGTAADNWHPLTWASHMLDVTLFGMDPAAHHLSSLFLHALNAALLFLLLTAMTGRRWRSALVAALFALHPLHVESVAWAAERKDLLSGLFWVLTSGAYLRYARRPGAGRYAALLLCFGLGLLTKPMMVTLPFILLLLDWWPLGRTSVNFRVEGHPGRRTAVRLLAEKVPLFALAIAAGSIVYGIQRGSGAMKELDALPLVARIFNALVSYVRYLEKTAWPFGLSPFYPHPGPGLALGTVFIALGVLLAITMAVRFAGRDRPWLAVGWLWYLGTLLPVIGIVQVGWQAQADRYTYLPLIGVFLALTWETGERCGDGRARRAAAAVALMLLAGLGALTWRQTMFWRDSVSVFTRAVRTTPDNLPAEFLLGKALRQAGNPVEAILHLREVTRINPRYADGYIELGEVLYASGDLEGAIGAYERVLQLKPDSAPTHNNLGYALARLGQTARALKHYEAALRIDPRFALAHENAAMALVQLGRDAEAVEHLRQAGPEADSPPEDRRR